MSRETMTITPLAPTHAADAARLHIAGQPGTFLTSLGADVLTVIYRALPDSGCGFGFAAHMPESTHLPEPIGELRVPEQTLGGFVSATTSMSQLMIEMGTRRVAHFAPPLLRRFVSQPQLALRSAQTLLYPFISRHKVGADQAGEDRSAELLSIMVEPQSRGQGVGTDLVAALCQRCRQQSIARLDVTVDAQNGAARRFYERHNFAHQYDFQLYGRTMCSYRLKL